MSIDALPTPAPGPTDTPSQFNARAFALLGALPLLITQIDATGSTLTAAAAAAVAAASAAGTSASDAYNAAVAANASANSAATSAGTATTKANAASTSAAAALASQNAAAASAATAVAQTFASGTRMLFAQAAAPTGWVQDTTDTANNRMLRVVTSVGGGVGGAHDPTVMDKVPSHTHGFSTGGASSDHSHGMGDPGHFHTKDTYGPQYAGAASGVYGLNANSAGTNTGTSYTGVYTGGMSTGHYHSGTTDGGSSGTNWTPRFVNLIICTKT